MKIMKKLVVLFTALYLVACTSLSYSPVYTNYEQTSTTLFYKHICIDNSFDKEDYDGIVSAIQEWNRAFNGVALLVVSSSCEWSIVKQVGDNTTNGVEITYESNAKYESVLAYAQIGGNTITVVRHHISSQYKLHRAIVHELGHLLGASHTPHGIMRVEMHAKDFMCIDESALSQIAKYRNFSCSHCNYCIQEP